MWDADESLRDLVPYELADLWAGDVPLFTARPDSRDVWSSDGTRIANVLATEGLAAVEAKIASLGDIDEHRQKWLISASLATRPEPIVHTTTASRPWLGATEADPECMLAAATDIADEIVAQVISERGGAANWLGLELLDDHHWAIRPMGAGLSNGYTGTALFLAQVGVLTGAGKYCELARDAIRPIPYCSRPWPRTRSPRNSWDPASTDSAASATASIASANSSATPSSPLVARVAGTHRADRPDPTEFPATPRAQPVDWPPCKGSTAARRPRLATRYADELVTSVESGLRGREADGHGFARGYQGIAWALGQYDVPEASTGTPRGWRPTLIGGTGLPATAGARATPVPHWRGWRPVSPRTSRRI